MSANYQSFLNAPSGPYLCWDKVNAPMIRQWCEVMGETNPVYLNRAAAQKAGYRDIVAPPTMLQVWTMRGYDSQFPSGSDDKNPFQILVQLGKDGYPGVVAVNCIQDYKLPVVVGDSIYHMSEIVSISEEKSTALGVGFFVTERSTFLNQNDEPVGTMDFRVFKYRPHKTNAPAPSAAGKPAAIGRVRPVRNTDTEFFWSGLEEGELRIQRCTSCQDLRHPPASMCPSCQSLDWDYITSSGRGQVFSFTVTHRPEIPPFDYPNLIALIELEEGTRLISNLSGVKRQNVQIGMPVKAIFEEVEDGLTLHRFVPVEEGGQS